MSERDDATLKPPARWEPLVDAVRDDHVHGASFLARRAAEILARCADETRARHSVDQGQAEHIIAIDSLDNLAALAWSLAWARPSMAAIANAVAAIWRLARPDMLESADHGAIAHSIERLRAAAEYQRAGWDSVALELERRIIPLLRDPVFTLSRSGSVERALLAAAHSHATDAPLEVIIAESRPGSEGVALAQSLATAGARVSVVTDSAIGVAMAHARTLLLGADSVRSDGKLINKVGSYPAALAATDLGIPVYALCERLKITPTSYPLTLEKITLEYEPNRREEEGVSENWLFDQTPARLITAFISEDGALSAEEIARAAEDAEAALKLLRDSVEQAHARRSAPGFQG